MPKVNPLCCTKADLQMNALVSFLKINVQEQNSATKLLKNITSLLLELHVILNRFHVDNRSLFLPGGIPPLLQTEGQAP